MAFQDTFRKFLELMTISTMILLATLQAQGPAAHPALSDADMEALRNFKSLDIVSNTSMLKSKELLKVLNGQSEWKSWRISLQRENSNSPLRFELAHVFNSDLWSGFIKERNTGKILFYFQFDAATPRFAAQYAANTLIHEISEYRDIAGKTRPSGLPIVHSKWAGRTIQVRLLSHNNDLSDGDKHWLTLESGQIRISGVKTETYGVSTDIVIPVNGLQVAIYQREWKTPGFLDLQLPAESLESLFENTVTKAGDPRTAFVGLGITGTYIAIGGVLRISSLIRTPHHSIAIQWYEDGHIQNVTLGVLRRHSKDLMALINAEIERAPRHALIQTQHVEQALIPTICWDMCNKEPLYKSDTMAKESLFKQYFENTHSHSFINGTILYARVKPPVAVQNTFPYSFLYMPNQSVGEVSQKQTLIHNDHGSTLSSPYELPKGTSIPLKLLHPLNNKNASLGDGVELEVAEDIRMNGSTIIAKGAHANGNIRVITQKDHFSGLLPNSHFLLAIEAVSVETVSGEKIPLSGELANFSDRDFTIPQGTSLKAQTFKSFRPGDNTSVTKEPIKKPEPTLITRAEAH